MWEWLGDLFGGGEKKTTQTTQNDIRQLPDYAEAEGARKNWWDTLQSWGPENNYGAIQPNWDDIWNNAAQKIQRYFMGGPAGPGAIATVKANSARRGMSENPGGDAAIARLLMSQGNQLGDLATNQAVEQANLGEKARTNWLSSLMGLAGLKPSFSNFGSTTERQTESPGFFEGAGTSLFKNLAGTGSTGFGQLDNILEPIMNLFGGNDTVSNLGDANPDGGDSGGFEAQDLIKYIPQIMAMFA